MLILDFEIIVNMALILNIETATTVCSVALSEDGKLIAMEEQDNGYTHAEYLTVFIDSVLKKGNYRYDDLSAVAVSEGPGSYTGLRIGVSVAKGLCFALNIPLIAVDTLMSIAAQIENVKSDQLICPMIDARRMEVYTALYNSGLEIQTEVWNEIIVPGSFDKYALKNQVIVCGNGASKCKELLSGSKFIYRDDVKCSSLGMMKISYDLFGKNKFVDVAYFEPFYLKEFIAGKKGTL